MPRNTAILQRLGLAHPIIQAPMAGGGDTPALVAAVSDAGGLGSIGAAYLSPDAIEETAAAVRKATDRPFAINLFAPMTPPDRPDPKAAIDRAAPFYAELGLDPPGAPALPADSFDDQLDACLDSGAAVFSFTFGVLAGEAIAAIKARGMMLLGTATTVEEATVLEAAGVDGIFAQGSEAGGHRGSFAGDPASTFTRGMIGTMALVPQIVDAVALPVIASGGIMDGRGIAAALALGASAVQMGTAFLVCAEAGVPDAYKDAIIAAEPGATRITRAFSGRPARGIENRFMRAVEEPGRDAAVLPFPYQNALTRPLRTAAAKTGRAEFLSLWAGQGLGLARRQSAAELMDRLIEETEAAIAGLAD
jgi:nitronate monooxygenase